MEIFYAHSPPALTLLCLFAIGALDGVLPGLTLQFPGQIVLASGIGLAGLTLVLIAIRGFYRVKTTVLPQEMEHSSTLVTGGVYQISRNPMYLGMAAIIAGPGLALGAWATLPVLAVFVWVITTYQIIPEEQALTKSFGDEFVNYKAQVRRWI
jgi:protein-S-isoprenylcysteine O-methyltransferase Ste14|tara:strand:+ start:1368 stop:1826 length:459 start_codon:yes stop_codon:yes gene_type:complete